MGTQIISSYKEISMTMNIQGIYSEQFASLYSKTIKTDQ